MKIKVGSKTNCLPDFLIVGAAKSGTTSLYHYLKQHPQVFMPENKEPWFFALAGEQNGSEALKGLNIVSDFDQYAALFNGAQDSQITGEASTGYLYLYEQTIANIKKYHPGWKDLKIIIILRNPVERAFSHYLNDVAAGFMKAPFQDVIGKCLAKQVSTFYNYIDYGFYCNQVKAYKESFNDVKVCLFDDLIRDPRRLMEDMFAFLGIDNHPVSDAAVKYNVSGIPPNEALRYLIYKSNPFKAIFKRIVPPDIRAQIKNAVLEKFLHRPQLEHSDRKRLMEIYREDILSLGRLINRDLAHWIG